MKRLITLIFILFSFLGNARNNENIDSLIVYGKKHQIDTLLAYSYDIAARNYKFSNIDTAYQLAKLGLNHALKANHLLYISDSYNTLGIIDKDRGDYELSINHQKLALNFALKYKGNSSYQQQNALSSIALVYWEQGNYSQALEMYYQNLFVSKKENDTLQIARAITNIGSVYFDQGLNEKALEKYMEAYQLAIALNNVFGQSLLLNNIGSVYHQQKRYDEAYHNFNKSLQISQQIEDLEGVSICYSNIGAIFFQKQQYDSALIYHQNALDITEKMGDKQGISLALNEIGKDYCELRNYNKALFFGEKSLKIAKEIGAKDNEKSAYEALYKSYEKVGDTKKAYQNYKAFISLRDSLFNEENQKKDIKNELNFEFQSKQYKDSLEQVKKDFITQQTLEKEKIKTASQQKLTFLFSISFLITLLLSIFIYKGYQKTKKANIIIEQQKHDVEKQRDIIHEKNKEITDSINYAKRIQEAILPSRYSLTENLSNGFVFFKPKDVVSGDFYWLETIQSDESSVMSDESPSLNTHHSQLIFFAAADCTGHGVPGAMVSLVCSNALSKALLEEGETDPGKLLDRTRKLVIERFAKSEEDVKDGMDIALCSLRYDVQGLRLKNKDTIALLQYAGANNPLWIIRPPVIASATKQSLQKEQIASLPLGVRNDGNFELIEFKPNKQPIGKVENPQPFTTHTIELQKGDTIYVFTDGYADQFGGEKGKKFKYKSLKELLLSIQEQTMEEQKETLHTIFEKWKGDLEQVDDICVIGVRI
ncbi:MAG: tetratricopeptide repeat protein [Bacteroidetes bacterium]|nr:tetratricopeptide repeat protein [Bacteroidota bacterium]